jgi:hypothetical protein
MKEIAYLRYWCHKILPLVYEDSLSYYEVLCKMKAKLNEVIENVNEIPSYIDEVIDEKLSDDNIKRILREYMLGIEGALSANNELDNTNAANAYSKGQLVWWKDKLYKAMVDIPVGTTLIENTNLELITFEELFNQLVDNIKDSISTNDETGHTNASQDWDMGDFIWFNDELYQTTKDIAEGTAFIFSGTNKNVNKVTIEKQIEVIYYPNDKKLSIHGKISDYSEIVSTGDYHIYHPRVEAIEIRKVD